MSRLTPAMATVCDDLAKCYDESGTTQAATQAAIAAVDRECGPSPVKGDVGPLLSVVAFKRVLDLKEEMAELERQHTIAPILDPTTYHKALSSGKLDRAIRMFNAMAAAATIVNQLVTEELEAKRALGKGAG